MAGTFTLSTFVGVMIPFAGTTLGSACVFFLKGEMSTGIRKTPDRVCRRCHGRRFLLEPLNPSLEMAEKMGRFAFVPAAVGFLIGMFFLLVLDLVTPHMHLDSTVEGPRSGMRRTTKLILAVTLHNIPEGMAVGVVYAGWLAGDSGLTAAGALALALGIAIQNFPEGAIVSMPPPRGRDQAKSRTFLYGMLSESMEPIASVLTIVASRLHHRPVFCLTFLAATGADVRGRPEELIPEMSEEPHSNLGPVAFAFGFVLMMIADVTWGNRFMGVKGTVLLTPCTQGVRKPSMTPQARGLCSSFLLNPNIFLHHLFRVEDLVKAVFREEAKLHTGLFQ